MLRSWFFWIPFAVVGSGEAVWLWILARGYSILYVTGDDRDPLVYLLVHLPLLALTLVPICYGFVVGTVVYWLYRAVASVAKRMTKAR